MVAAHPAPISPSPFSGGRIFNEPLREAKQDRAARTPAISVISGGRTCGEPPSSRIPKPLPSVTLSNFLQSPSKLQKKSNCINCSSILNIQRFKSDRRQ
jgi:hypothetical protein